MRTLRFKLTCWFAAALFSLAFVVLLGFALDTANNIRHSEKVELKFVARSIERELGRNSSAGHLSAEVISTINEKLAFMDGEGLLAYAVLSPQGQLLYKSTDFMDDVRRYSLEGEKIKLFWGMKSSEDWHFLFRHLGSDYVIFVSNMRHVELLEKLLVVYAGSMVVILLLAFGFGYLISGKITRPLHKIAVAVDRIGAGDLSARIPLDESRDELSRLARSLNASFAQLEDSFARVSQFSYDAAHELKTPLTAIRGNLEVALSRTRSVEEYQQVIASGVEDVAMLTAIVNDLLLLVRPGHCLDRCALVPVNFSLEVESVVEQMDYLAQQKDVVLKATLAPGLYVAGVETFLRRLCGNLVHNALKFSPVGGIIEISLSGGENGFLCFTVRDHGVGIAKEHQNKIFDRFFVVDSSHNSGTGLGLALVKWMVDLHHGTITLDSVLGEGATFQVLLPRLVRD
jgi:signal transduction histidine kinase